MVVDTLYLDNGTTLEVVPNGGCGGCNAGNYYITELNGCDNAITRVEFDCKDEENDCLSYKIFVYAENKEIKILQVDGEDGNGMYGTGYSIVVHVPKESEKPAPMKIRPDDGLEERIKSYQKVLSSHWNKERDK